MTTLEQLRESLGRAWETLSDGWRQLFRRTGRALTRFRPRERDGELAVRNVGWGLLAAEVSEDERRITVRLEAPGMERDDFDIEVIDDTLVVRGEKRYQREHEDGDYYLAECAYGSFERAIALPDEVDADAATARYKRGVLHIELPRTKARHTRRINVSS